MSNVKEFIPVGENIHCTRIYKVGGKYVKTLEDGRNAIVYKGEGKERHLPVPDVFLKSNDWKNGKVKHAAVAIWQGYYGNEEVKRAGIDYLNHMAKEQEKHGAKFLDVNVDEFSVEVEECNKIMQWTAEIVQKASTVPLSIDSSRVSTLEIGLSIADPSRGKPMVNSVSLERRDAIRLAKEKGAAVIAGAGGRDRMPSTTEERLKNLDELLNILFKEGFEKEDIYVDPLVFPVSVDQNNGKTVLESIREIRKKYGQEIHFAPGLSNISYGMPKRKLINQVFTYLCVEEGLDGGIVDPLQINGEIISRLDTQSEAFSITRAFLLGEDMFGQNFIAAAREGKI